jgi:glycine oxidase
MPRDVVIIGGGIIGCSIAWRLAQAGLQVTLIERGNIGEQASWAAAGLLAPHSEAGHRDDFFNLSVGSLALWPGFARELEEESGIDVEYRTDGAIYLAVDETERQQIDGWLALKGNSESDPRAVPAAELASLEPEISAGLADGIFFPGDHQVDNRLVMRALSAVIRDRGAEVLEGRAVDALSVTSGRIDGLIVDGERIDCGKVVIAAGCWSSSLAATAGLNLPLVPARGQMLAVRGPNLTRVVHGAGCYLVPRCDGRLLIGATVEYAGFERAVTVAGLRSLFDAAVRLVPSIESSVVVESWSGLRPDTPDHLPILGASGIRGLTLATGHFRNGILLAPITAQLVAEAVLSGRFSGELAPFSLHRFT